MQKLKLVEAMQMKSGIQQFKPGDTVNVHVRVVEGDKERIQIFSAYYSLIRICSGFSADCRFRCDCHLLFNRDPQHEIDRQALVCYVNFPIRGSRKSCGTSLNQVLAGC